MAESFSVKAVLSAVDSGFSSTLNGATRATESLASKIKNGFAFGVLSGVGQQAFSTITGSVQNLFSEAMETSDAMQKLQQAMRFSGSTEAEIERIAGSTGTLKTYADKTVFSLQDVMSTFGALSANGIADADKMTEAVGNAVAVFGGGANEFSSVALAFSQSMAAGKMNAQDWNQILNASPQLAGGLKKELQSLCPALEKDFKGAMEDGAITAELLGEAMTNIGMTDMAKEAAQSTTTFEGAMGNLEATVSSGLMTLYDSFGKSALIDVINGFGEKVGGIFDWLGETIPSAIDTITPYWEKLKKVGSKVGGILSGVWKKLSPIFSSVASAIGTAISFVLDKLGELDVGSIVDAISNGVDTAMSYWDAFKSAFDGVWPSLVEAFGVIRDAVQEALGSVDTSSGLDAFASVMETVAGAIKSVADWITENKDKISAAMPYILQIGGAFAGLMIANRVAPGLMSVAGSIAKMAAGGIASLVGRLFGIAGGTAAAGASSASAAPSMMQSAVACLALGAAVLLAAAGLALIVQSAIALASAGWPAVAAAAGLVVVIALLAVGAAALAPALTAGSVGFIAFGAAIALVGVGAILLAASLAIMASVFPTIIAFAGQAAAALYTLSGGLTVFAVGAALAGVACAALGAGLLVVGAAVLVLAAGFVLLAAATILTAAGVLLLSAGLLMATAALGATAALLPIVAAGASLASAAFMLLVATSTALSVLLLAISASMLALTAAALASTVGVAAFGVAIAASAVGAAAMAAALLLVAGSMSTIASDAKQAEDSLNSMQDSVSVVESGLKALGDLAESAMDGLTGAFEGAAGDAVAAGTEVGTGFASGMTAGLIMVNPIALMAVALVGATLRSGQQPAYEAGAYIGKGFANGMKSQLAVIRSAAAQMAAAADAAVRAKAQIASPSKVAAGLGAYWGEGFAEGISSMEGDVWDASAHLVSIPNVAAPEMSMYGGEMSSDYRYFRDTDYTIEVPLSVDGKEFARATASYTQSELDRKQTRDSRKHGRI